MAVIGRAGRVPLERQAPELTGASVLKDDHPYHGQFVKWLDQRRQEMGDDSAQPNKRKGRLFLVANPQLRTCWPSVWAAKERIRLRNQRVAA